MIPSADSEKFQKKVWFRREQVRARPSGALRQCLAYKPRHGIAEVRGEGASVTF